MASNLRKIHSSILCFNGALNVCKPQSEFSYAAECKKVFADKFFNSRKSSGVLSHIGADFPLQSCATGSCLHMFRIVGSSNKVNRERVVNSLNCWSGILISCGVLPLWVLSCHLSVSMIRKSTRTPFITHRFSPRLKWTRSVISSLLYTNVLHYL